MTKGSTVVAQQVVASPTPAGIFLVLTVEDGGEDTVRGLLGDLADLTKGVAFRSPDDLLNCVVGIGSDLWDRLYDGPRPARLHPFAEIRGATHTAVSTPGDLLVHLRSRRLDLCFELAHQVTRRLRDAATVIDEVHGFTFFDERDLLGFVDGTANPEGAEAESAVLVGDEDPDFAGGSYVTVQKYLHDLDAWRSLTVEQQEAAIGRSKLEDIEMPDADKPSNSHVALTTVHDADGTELDIVRDNMPFGRVGEREFGTYFIGYAKDPRVIEEMLRNMYIGKPEGNHDRILDFSTPVTGSSYFVPTRAYLEAHA